MCNCTKTCNQCSSGLPCNCPPDYTIAPLPTTCNCCPPGYTFYGATPNYPNGYCQGAKASDVIAASVCTTCEESMSTDCVFYECTTITPFGGCALQCSGVVNGDNLTTILTKMCVTNPANILAMLQVIAADTTYGLKQAFCTIADYCSGIPGDSTPYIGPISFSIP